MRLLLFLLFLEGILDVENPQAQQFTLRVWLLRQILGSMSPEAAKQANVPVSDRAQLSALQQELDTVGDAIEQFLEGGPGAGEIEQFLADQSEQVVQALETHLPRIAVPADWQVAWMGVEG